MAARWFFRFAVSFALIGLALGLYMGGSHDFTYAPVHAHINLVGWVSMFLAGLFYSVKPKADNRLALIHLGLAVVGLLLLAPGIYASIAVLPWAAPVVGAGSVITYIGFILFAYIVFRNTGKAA